MGPLDGPGNEEYQENNSSSQKESLLKVINDNSHGLGQGSINADQPPKHVIKTSQAHHVHD